VAHHRQELGLGAMARPAYPGLAQLGLGRLPAVMSRTTTSVPMAVPSSAWRGEHEAETSGIPGGVVTVGSPCAEAGAAQQSGDVLGLLGRLRETVPIDWPTMSSSARPKRCGPRGSTWSRGSGGPR
jgi:hypothetical protein